MTNTFDNSSPNLELHEPCSHPFPTKDIDLKMNLSALKKKIVKGIIKMLQITTFEWEDPTVLRGTKQMIRYLAPVIMQVDHTCEILASTSGWDL